MSKPKILLWDIESSFNVLYSFDLHPEHIPHDNIITERHIFCISYKWYGQKKIHTISILDDPKRFKRDIHDDSYVINEFRKVMEQADAQVAHYGDRFDVRMLNGRMLFHGIDPLPQIKSYDTKKLASKYFKLNSNRLDYLGQYLGYKGKLHNPKKLWHRCMEGDIKSLKHMAKYNKQDIDVLDFVFKKLMPFVKDHQLNTGMFLNGIRCTNPVCGSDDIQWRGWNYTRVSKYRRFVCKNCGQWSNERKAAKGSPQLK